MRIDKIQLQNFRSFADHEFNLDPRLTLIIGNNASGKTSILEALSVSIGGYLLGIPNGFAGVTKQAHKRNFNDDDIHRFFAKNTEVIQTEFSNFTSVKATGSIQVDTEVKTVEWERTVKGLGVRTNNSGCQKIQNIAAKMYETSIQEGGQTLPILMYYGTGRLWAGQKTNIKKLANTNTALGYYYSLKPDAQNKILMPWIEKMHDISRDKNETLSILQCVYDTVTHFIPDADNCYYSREYDELTVVFGEREFPFSLLSDGQRNIISLVGDIAMRCAHLNQHLGKGAANDTPGIVLVDEVDSNIHPSWQKELLPKIKDYFKHIQFIFTTHSPYIIQSIKNGKIINLDDKYSVEATSEAWKKSIEEVSADIMHVETQRSSEFQNMIGTAKRYYQLLDAEDGDENEISNISRKLDEYEERFSGDPTFIAVLMAERRKKGL